MIFVYQRSDWTIILAHFGRRAALPVFGTIYKNVQCLHAADHTIPSYPGVDAGVKQKSVLPSSRFAFLDPPKRLTALTKENYSRHLSPLYDLLARGDPATALNAALLSCTRPPPMAQTLQT